MIVLFWITALILIRIDSFTAFFNLQYNAKRDIKLNMNFDREVSPKTKALEIIRNPIIKTLSATAALGLLNPMISKASSYTDYEINEIPVTFDGGAKPLKNYLGPKCTLIINVASECALTPQYEELVELYSKFHDKGFEILAFPCNQFGSQEPAPVEKIRRDIGNKYGVKFTIMDKIDVNGPGTHPLYQRLKSYKNIGVENIGKISWNFEKFLVDQNGTPLRRYKPGITPLRLSDDIDSLITKGVVTVKKKPSLNDFS